MVAVLRIVTILLEATNLKKIFLEEMISFWFLIERKINFMVRIHLDSIHLCLIRCTNIFYLKYLYYLLLYFFTLQKFVVWLAVVLFCCIIFCYYNVSKTIQMYFTCWFFLGTVHGGGSATSTGGVVGSTVGPSLGYIGRRLQVSLLHFIFISITKIQNYRTIY